MPALRIFHNPRCSKSRQTLQLLNDKGFKPQVIEYLKNPPSVTELADIIGKLGFSSARQLIRKGEQEFKDLNLADESLSEQELVKAMTEAPKLIERPIVITETAAKVGRPPESVLDIL